MKTSLENLKPLTHCSVCRQKYEPAKALFLEEYDGQTALYITCAACHVSTVVFVSANQSGMMSMGMLTDLDESEVRSLFGSEAVSSDQVLEMHAFLKNPVSVGAMLSVH